MKNNYASLPIKNNVVVNVIDKETNQVVQSYEGHNECTNSLLSGVAHYLVGDGVLNQAQSDSILSAFVPKYISLGTMGLLSQEADANGLPKHIGDTNNPFGYSADNYPNTESAIGKLYDDYAHAITVHMKNEEKQLFPYVDALLDGKVKEGYDIETYSKHHGQESNKLVELKSIIIKYLPSDGLHNNKLSATLYDIYNNEDWLRLHTEVEENIFTPAILNVEKKLKHGDVTAKISSMLSQQQNSGDVLSDREKDVVVALVQGMSNKEIGDHLCIATNTVITHRRNIARKLQIHSVAGLTIYAIVNDLVDISAVKL